MRGRSIGLLVLAGALALLLFSPTGAADMEAPTMTSKPTLDGKIDQDEWSSATSYEFGAPRSGTSSFELGFLPDAGDLAMGLTLSDGSNQDDDNVTVLIAQRETSKNDGVQSGDLKIEIDRDGAWTFSRGQSNGNWSTDSSGDDPSDTDADELEFAVVRTGDAWKVELRVEVNSLDEGDEFAMAVIQVDDGKQSHRGSAAQKQPGKWETTTLPGQLALMRLRAVPSQMAAGVGGAAVVTLPSDISSGALKFEVKEPGADSFREVERRTPAKAGENRFVFVPEATGTYELRAYWAGDKNYANSTTDARKVTVQAPTLANETVNAGGGIRATFPTEAGQAPAVWSYLNARVSATDGSGHPLSFVTLSKDRTCQDRSWTGFANTGQGSLVLTFDPPIDRAGLVLASTDGEFSARWTAIDASGSTLSSETLKGTCSGPAYVAAGEKGKAIESLEITYTGDVSREVVRLLTMYPQTSTEPKVTTRTDPAPLRAGGNATVLVSSGGPTGVDEVKVTVEQGATKLDARTCTASDQPVWLDCPIDVDLPPNAGSIRVKVRSTVDGTSHTSAKTLTTVSDQVPPEARLIPNPMVVPEGSQATVRVNAEDGSGVASIDLRAETASGERLSSPRCDPVGAPRTLECQATVSPPSDERVFASATVTDAAGNSRELGPKPVPVRGPDDDGDGLPNELELEIGTSPKLSDTDDDGLSDGWEVIGVDRNGDGQAELDLASLGADPQVQDVFVEEDWAQTSKGSHALNDSAIQLARNVLASHGIRLHTLTGQGASSYDVARFDHGHAAHRALIDEDRAGIFYHVLSGGMGGPAAGGGNTIYLPTQPGQDPGVTGPWLLHELGHHLGLGHGGGDSSASTQKVFTEDYKPNYFSLMNSAYARGVVVQTSRGPLHAPGFSGVDVGSIDETSLDEATGLDFDLQALGESLRAGPTAILDAETLNGVMIRYTCPNNGPVRWTMVPGSVDWNCNGGASDSGVEADVNRGGANAGISSLSAPDDWQAMNLGPPPCPQYALALEDDQDYPADDANHNGSYAPLGLAPCPLQEPPEEVLAAQDPSQSIPEPPLPSPDVERPNDRDDDGDGSVDEGYLDDDGDGVVNLLDDCPTQSNAAQLDLDDNGRGDRCQAAPAKPANLAASSSPAGIRLTWDSVLDAWGYNVYRVDSDNATRLGSGFPTTKSTSFEDPGGSGDVRYLVTAVDELADQSQPAEISATGTGPSTNDTSDGNESEEKGAPSVGSLLAVAAVSIAALARRRW